MRYFRLLKNSFEYFKDDIFCKDKDDSFYTLINGHGEIHKNKVENNPEWFEEAFRCEKCGEFKSLWNKRTEKFCFNCKELKQTIKIEKWLVFDNVLRTHMIWEIENTDIYCEKYNCLKIKKLSEYEIEL